MIIKKLYTIIFSLAAVFLFLLQACVNNELEELEAREKKIIGDYLALNPEFTKTEGGIYILEDRTGNGLTPAVDEWIFVNFVGRYLEDSTIRETTYDSLKSEWPASDGFENYLYGPSKILYGYSMPGLNEAVSLMKEGGKATFIIPGDKANYDYRPLLYEIELIRVVKDIKALDDSALFQYIDKKGFLDTAIVDTTVWVRLDETINNDSIVNGDTVFMRFEGRLIDGFGDSVVDNRIFNSNLNDEAPLKFVYPSKVISGKILGNKIPEGLVTALRYIKRGKGSVIIRYPRAFKEAGYVHEKENYIIVPKFQSVVYDIEVTQIISPPGN